MLATAQPEIPCPSLQQHIPEKQQRRTSHASSAWRTSTRCAQIRSHSKLPANSVSLKDESLHGREETSLPLSIRIRSPRSGSGRLRAVAKVRSSYVPPRHRVTSASQRADATSMREVPHRCEDDHPAAANLQR
eukprot:1060048-Pleurochrysis_carterae.AAC.1